MRKVLKSLASKLFKPASSIEILAACLAKNEDAQARAHLNALCGTAPSWLEQNLKLVIEAFQDNGKLAALVDALLSPQIPSFTYLSVARRTGELARSAGRFDDFQRRVQSVIASGGTPHFGPFAFIRKSTGFRRDPQLYRLLLKLKYNGIDDYERPDRLFASAETLASRVILGQRMLEWLYQHRRDRTQSQPAWEQSIKTAYALQHLIRDAKITEADQMGLVDAAAGNTVLARLNPTRGTLLLLFHVGFSTVSINFLKRHIEGIVLMASGDGAEDRGEQEQDRLVADKDPRVALFAAMKALLKNRVVIVSPDGGQGTQRTEISVLGEPAFVAEGAALLAYEAKCDTFWFSMNRGEDRFVPTLIAGPCRLGAESFPEFQRRLVGFYEKMLNDAFAGDPRNLPLRFPWLSYFNEKKIMTAQPRRRNGSRFKTINAR